MWGEGSVTSPDRRSAGPEQAVSEASDFPAAQTPVGVGMSVARTIFCEDRVERNGVPVYVRDQGGAHHPMMSRGAPADSDE